MASPVDQVEKVQDLITRDPSTFWPALFVVAFFSLLILHLRTVAKQAKEHADTLLALAVRFEHLSTRSLEVMAECRAALGKKRPRRPTREADSTQVTAMLDPKEVADGSSED